MRRTLASSALMLTALVAPSLVAPRAARAQSRGSAISWAPDPALDCIDQARLTQEVEGRLHRPHDVDLDLSVRGRAERTEDGGVRAVLVLYAPGEVEVGARTVETEETSCRALDQAVPIVVAMMLNVPREELAIFLPPPPPSPAEPRVDEAAPAPSPGARAGNETSAAAVALVGVMPDVTIGVRVGAVASIESRSVIGLDVIVAPESVRSIARGEVAFRMVSVGVTSCALGGPVAEWLRLELCAGVRLGALWAEPAGFDESHPALEWLVEVELGGRAALAIAGPAWATIALAGTVPLPQPAFGYQGGSGEIVEIHRVAPVAGRLELGLCLRFE